MDFAPFSRAVAQRFNELSKHELYKIKLGANESMFNLYLSLFTEEENPIFRTKRVFDCRCCHTFIKNVGDVVAVGNGRVETVWEKLGDVPEPFGRVAAGLDAFVRGDELEKKLADLDSED